MNYLDLKQVASGLEGSIAASAVARFYEKGGVIGYNVPGEVSRYIANADQQKAGVILVDPQAVTKLVPVYGSELAATRAIIVHELGHFAFDATDRANTPGANSTLQQRVDFCITREAEASTFAFNVAQEHVRLGLKAVVPGTAASPDLYALMQSSSNPLAAAFQAFSADRNYVKYCTDNNGKVSGYLAPGQDGPTATDGDGTDVYSPGYTPGTSTGGGGSGDAGYSSGGYSGGGTDVFVPPSSGPIGGGYWRYPPEKDTGPVTGSEPAPAADSEAGNPVTLIGIADADASHLFF